MREYTFYWSYLSDLSNAWGIESLAGDLCMVWVIGWLCSTLRIRDIVSLQMHSWVLRVSCDVWCYRRQRFKPFGLSDRVYLVIVSLDLHRFKPCGSMIGLEAWVHGFKSCGFSGHVLKGFCLEHKLWVVFRVCLSCLWSPVCVMWGLLRVLLVCGNELCIVVHLALRPSNICCPSCY